MNRADFTAQFVGFTVEVTCVACGEKLAVPNDTPNRQMDQIIKKFRKSHEKAHQPEKVVVV